MSTPLLDKTYNWNKLEECWYQHWLDSNYFEGKSASKKESSLDRKELALRSNLKKRKEYKNKYYKKRKKS